MDDVGTMAVSTVRCRVLHPLHLHSELRQILLSDGVTQRKEYHSSHCFTQCGITWRRVQADVHIWRCRSEQLEVVHLVSTNKSYIHRHVHIWKPFTIFPCLKSIFTLHSAFAFLWNLSVLETVYCFLFSALPYFLGNSHSSLVLTSVCVCSHYDQLKSFQCLPCGYTPHCCVTCFFLLKLLLFGYFSQFS